MEQLLYGAAYYDEYMPYERLEEDVKMWKKAGMNVVRIAESTWSTCEPQEGVFGVHYHEFTFPNQVGLCGKLTEGTDADTIFNRFQNIFGIAAAGNPDDIIAGLEEIFKLLNKDIVIADIIGVGHHSRNVIIQADKLKTFVKTITAAFIEIAAKMRSR